MSLCLPTSRERRSAHLELGVAKFAEDVGGASEAAPVKSRTKAAIRGHHESSSAAILVSRVLIRVRFR